MIYYNKQSISIKDIKAVNSALNSDYLTQGPLNLKFEKKLCNFFGSKYCNLLSNGTVALFSSLIALNLKKNDVVLVSPLSFVAGAMSALFLKHPIDFVDINNNTYSLCERLLEEKILQLKKNKKRIGCVIVTDYSGIPANWKELYKLKTKYKFKIINDNCHAIGSKYLNSNKYAVNYADIVVQSYHAIKNITTAEGGAVFTNNRQLNKRILNLKSHGISRSIKKKNIHGLWHYDIKFQGLNFRLSEIQCALGISQLSKIKTFLNKRKKISNIYNKSLSELDFVKIPPEFSDRVSSNHIYPLLIDFKKIKISKKKLFEILRKKGYTLQVNYIPTYKFTLFKNKFRQDYFPNTEKFYKSEISLPCYYNLSLKDAKKFSVLLKKILQNYAI